MRVCTSYADLFTDLVNEKARFLKITPQELQQRLNRGEGGPAGDKTRAAIASRLAAEIYGLDVLLAERTKTTTPRASSCSRAMPNGRKATKVR
jgi:hypothetical protein